MSGLEVTGEIILNLGFKLGVLKAFIEKEGLKEKFEKEAGKDFFDLKIVFKGK